MSKYKCERCGYETDHNGAFNLHDYHCKLRRKAGVTEPIKRQSKNVSCEHEFRLLDPTDPIEQRAIQSNFSEVCEKCQNVQ